MIAFIIILIAIAGIGFLQGGFIALIVSIISSIIGYFTSIYLTLVIVVLVAASLVYFKVKNK
ncbi:hypothetical protein SMGD1_2063 [Sulfurimonas gotlandica GD1]|uniref:Uncharacterized protein n=1 Tax=Sulfurimonas gotlandica (strain DSM 19862 / JCM 16533 / GD1) TaxID=929558 RepID=H1FX90_SULGG|nr:hypothetical protein [Sulfurimonas gotlandica]EHP30586.1 hypothetical protein SMGD1_2063 [Sulfurimonas gotlandica GD1]